MKFLAAILVLTILFVVGSLASMMSTNPGLTLLTFVPCAGIVYPLLWVACYRVGRDFQVTKRR